METSFWNIGKTTTPVRAWIVGTFSNLGSGRDGLLILSKDGPGSVHEIQTVHSAATNKITGFSLERF